MQPRLFQQDPCCARSRPVPDGEVGCRSGCSGTATVPRVGAGARSWGRTQPACPMPRQSAGSPGREPGSVHPALPWSGMLLVSARLAPRGSGRSHPMLHHCLGKRCCPPAQVQLLGSWHASVGWESPRGALSGCDQATSSPSPRHFCTSPGPIFAAIPVTLCWQLRHCRPGGPGGPKRPPSSRPPSWAPLPVPPSIPSAGSSLTEGRCQG